MTDVARASKLTIRRAIVPEGLKFAATRPETILLLQLVQASGYDIKLAIHENQHCSLDAMDVH
jgi:hypothetical protein